MTAADQNNVIAFSVTPVAATGAPKVGNELKSANTYEVVVSGSTGARFVLINNGQSLNSADSACLNLSIGGSSLWTIPTVADMDTLYSRYPSDQIGTVLGWRPFGDTSWVSDMAGSDHLAYKLSGGYSVNGASGSSAFGVICVMRN